MLALTHAHLASDFGPPVQHVFPDYFVSGVVVIMLFAYFGTAIWDRLRRKPPLEDIFTTKAESARVERELKAYAEVAANGCRDLEERTEKKIDALDRRREQGEKDTRELLHREIGGLKQFVSDRIAENRETNKEQFGAIFGKLDSFQVSMQGLTNDVMHQIGKLEGQLVEVAKRKGA